MGIPKKIVKAAGRKALESAKTRIRKADKHWCPTMERRNHRMIMHTSKHGHSVPFCGDCGWTDHKKVIG